MSSSQIVRPQSRTAWGMKYYAEYLSNINSVGLYFETESSEVTPSQIATDQDGTAATIGLSGGSQVRLSLPAAVRHSAAKLTSSATSVRIPASKSLHVPTAAVKLPPKCSCNCALTGPGVKWKRLPSEHWAELMDLWHCHKPAEPTKGGNSLYDLAMNGFHALPGQAYFSDTYFLVHEADIAAAEHAPDCQIARRARESSSKESTKLWRWDLDAGPVGQVVSDILAELIDAHAVYTYEINKTLLLWVFNPNVIYTLTGAGSPARGCKVFYGPAADLRQQRPDAEAVDLPAVVCDKLVQELAASNSKLPGSVQAMGKWRLAII